MKNCLDHLHICNAECCKQFRLIVNPRNTYAKGSSIYFATTDEDYLLYLKLHGQKVSKKGAIIKLDNFHKLGKYLTIYAECGLLDGNKCKEHFTKNRPKICEFPNASCSKHKDIYITKNCIFKEEN